MTKGTLLETCPNRKKDAHVEVIFSFAPMSKGLVPVGSVVTSLGEFYGQVGFMYLRCVSASGVCWVRLKNLQQHRPGSPVDESKVVERPRRLSAKKKGRKRKEPEKA